MLNVPMSYKWKVRYQLLMNFCLDLFSCSKFCSENYSEIYSKSFWQPRTKTCHKTKHSDCNYGAPHKSKDFNALYNIWKIGRKGLLYVYLELI